MKWILIIGFMKLLQVKCSCWDRNFEESGRSSASERWNVDVLVVINDAVVVKKLHLFPERMNNEWKRGTVSILSVGNCRAILDLCLPFVSRGPPFKQEDGLLFVPAARSSDPLWLWAKTRRRLTCDGSAECKWALKPTAVSRNNRTLCLSSESGSKSAPNWCRSFKMSLSLTRTLFVLGLTEELKVKKKTVTERVEQCRKLKGLPVMWTRRTHKMWGCFFQPVITHNSRICH